MLRTTLCWAALLVVVDSAVKHDTWSCPWQLRGFQCADGKYYCRCPGDGTQTWFQIGCCYKFPKCGRICHGNKHSCDKYSNCASCRSGTGEWSKNLCIACKRGFEIGAGNCQTDINECQTRNGGCEHNCVNTPGSYHCTCKNGFKLHSDKHRCDDINECQSRNGGCEHNCVNTPGSFHCTYKNGFKLHSDKHRCDDINECQSRNGGCEHHCANTQGSYHCTCRDGFKLRSDNHACDRLTCGHPGGIKGATVAPTAAWMFESYAIYQCDSPTFSLVGHSNRKCLGSGPNVYWSDVAPQCRDICSTMEDIERRLCGSSSVNHEKCIQLGCCYNDISGLDFPNCYHNPVWSFMKFSGQRPTVNEGNGFKTQGRSTVEGCSFQCIKDEMGKCKSFGIRQRGFDEKHGVNAQDCHLQEHSRSYYAFKSQLFDDAKYDIYQPLTVDTTMPLMSMTGKPIDLLNKLSVGCFVDDADHRDLSYHMFTSASDMTIGKCQVACRQQVFKYAGLQNGMECYCSNSLHRLLGPSDDCNMSCTGERTEICGGKMANSVYHVPHDPLYRGCYRYMSQRDLPMLIWKNDAGRSAKQCIEECALVGYKYAGVQNGGTCYCGSSYGRHGVANETQCHMRCEGWAHQNCGGVTENAIYITQIPFDISSGVIGSNFSKVFDSCGKISGIPTRLFTLAPHLRSVVTKKLVIYSSNEVQTPYDDWDCQDNCYEPCGTIEHVDQLTKIGESLILRFFHIRLSDITKYTGSVAKKVYIYAQTVVIDESINVNFALLIYTRQLIIDRSHALTIDVHSSAPDLDIDMATVKNEGLEPELLHRKMSFACARILIETGEPKHINTAWGIITDIGNNLGTDNEVAAYSAHVRSYKSYLYGVGRNDIHYVPYYTKSHIFAMLVNYHEKLVIYKDKLGTIESSKESQDEVIKVAEEMQKIYKNTDITQAQSNYDASKIALEMSNATYYRLKENFGYSRRLLKEARLGFERSLEEISDFRIIKTIFKLVDSISKVAFGAIDIGADNLKDSMDGVINDAQGMVHSIKISAFIIRQIEAFDRMTEEIFHELDDLYKVHDSLKFLDDIEMTVGMHNNLIHWTNFKNYTQTIFPEVMTRIYRSAAEYKNCLMDTVNWGEALTKSMIEKAELVRYSMECKFTLNAKLRQQKRIQWIFDKAHTGLEVREEIIRAIYEQTYDVRADINNALITFCQAYFHENLRPCNDSYKPSFRGSLNDLLLKINSTRRDNILIPGNAQFTVSRYINVIDSDTDPNCVDAKVCPLNYFRKHRIFVYTLPIDHPDLVGLEKYRVTEILLHFAGAQPISKNRFLKMTIESSGDFLSKYQGDTYTFLTRPINLAFEYDVIDGHVSLRADIYKPHYNIASHITPYSTWVMRVAEERSADVDVSGVTSLTMRLDGSASTSTPSKGTLTANSESVQDHIIQ